MKEIHRYALWLGSGNQRRAVARALRAVMTGKEIVAAAQNDAPRITLRDLNPILRQLAAWELVRCLNRNSACGRLFVPTRAGCAAFARTCGELSCQVVALPPSLAPSTVSFVLRGATRHAVFDCLTRMELAAGRTVSVSELKKELRTLRPVSRNQVARALDELADAKLVQKEKTAPRDCRFRLAKKGRNLSEFLGHTRWHEHPKIIR